ncbi:bifunctional 2',3'-cyclic-nucleotide 2'-phosphodiesterase/3'-nucleotidase [Mitsuaria sp. WAJ17]|uniref:bifunctional 2',3'-cyclic-nucleotide 2'-phosphodiesterase/3'-nucleotidase n=1 Tax=Mitsuaria sp. WAJ17 TaxID=2761452 RepID=UPI0016008150|nr:bifunctional 2',3'-cyclic-nucleotide 2'-phosphodiesterase/3'-nucleotidase [Mitsuaria sp. WAJ17]MBB2485683.1 bifunctional 2',3'-cyclic-nucleotide 2'-phosphodiesterase/3'-nucleotidase [Mitsuaria sp. WAJ17]
MKDRAPFPRTTWPRRGAIAALGLCLATGLQAQTLKLRLLETSDIHMNLLAYDYYQDQPSSTQGLSHTARLIAQARAEQPNHLLLDNGDLIQGSAMGDVVAKQGLAAQAHPALQSLRLLGYDAANIGNHEFNFGLPFLKQAYANAGFPVISSNLREARSGKPVFTPSVLLRRDFTDEHGRPQRLRIGVLGLLPPQILQWDRQHLQGRVVAEDMVVAARREIRHLRAAGADLVIALAHTGYSAEPQPEGAENRAGDIARLPGLDALLLGHAHAEFPGPAFARHAGADLALGRIHGVPAVMPGSWGSHLGVIDLRLEKQAGRWRVVDSRGSLRPLRDARSAQAPAEPDTALEALLQPAHQATLTLIRQTVAQAPRPLHSYFDLVQPSESLALVARAQRAYAREALRGTRWQDLPLLSAAAPLRNGGRQGWSSYVDITPGPMSIKHVTELYPYPNTLKVLQLSGAEVREWLERSAAQFRQLQAGLDEAQALIDEAQPSFNYDVILGLDYAIDLAQPARYGTDGKRLPAVSTHRIGELRYRGQPVRDDQLFLLATNSYRAGGGGNFPAAGPERIVLDAAVENREALQRLLQSGHAFEAEADEGRWTLTLPEGTRAQFRCGPAARGQLPEAGRLRWVQDSPEGFAVFELRP